MQVGLLISVVLILGSWGLFFFWVLRGKHFYWYWPVALVAVATPVYLGAFLGFFIGTFATNPVTLYREYFFSRFVECVESTSDFAAALDLMQRKIDSGEFLKFIGNQVPPLPSELLFWGALAAFVAMVGVELIRQKTLRKTLILGLALLGTALFTHYEYGLKHSIGTKIHILMSYQDEVRMIAEFHSQAVEVRLGQKEIAAAIRSYWENNRNVCHREPYEKLLSELGLKPTSSPESRPGI
ncbi:MAG: hypothetical protein AB7F32_02395 [Victivallaceae bacterium]